jgi:hypothetical protein
MMSMEMVPEQEMQQDVMALLQRLEDRIDKRFDKMEERVVSKNELATIADRVQRLEDHSWDRDMVQAAKNHWPWIIALIVAVLANWNNIWNVVPR